MTPERWRQINRLFEVARVRPAHERAGFLETATEGDPDLRREVESLLAQADSHDHFFGPPALVDRTPSDREAQPGRGLVGAEFGSYRIVSLLGAGGMGEVYLAQDRKLGRDVAIKVLPSGLTADPDRRARFEREARVLASLSHSNIGSIYGLEDFGGRQALVLEYVAGETLEDRLRSRPIPMAEALGIARQIADALDTAHAKGVVHRDLKPANVKVAPEGRVKVLDFGLAKAALGDAPGPDFSSQVTMTAESTRLGLIVGTPRYMSPEQARGDVVDRRTDIWAFGCVVYELLTRRVAFAGPTIAETIAAVLERAPDWTALPTATPEALRSLLRQCLEKDPERRLRDFRDVRLGIDALLDTASPAPTSSAERLHGRHRWAWGAVGAAALAVGLIAGLPRLRSPSGAEPTTAAKGSPPSIAALPLANLSGDPGDEYVANGITDSLITDLAGAPNLSVIARDAVFRYKDRGIDSLTAGRELGVTYVLEGSVQRSGDKVRVNMRLVDVTTGRNIWAAPFEQEAKDLFRIQAAIADRTLEALRSNLSPTLHGTPRRPTTNERAYDDYLQGLYYYYNSENASGTPERSERAITFFERAIAADPEFALAHGALGSAFAQRAFYFDTNRVWEQKAFAAIERALALDPDLAEAYLARAQLAWSLPNGFPHETAVRDLRRALALSPSLAVAYGELAKIYQHVGLLDKSREASAHVLRLDPGNTVAMERRRLTYIYERQCTTAIELVEREAAGRRRTRAEALDCAGRTDEASKELAAIPTPGEMERSQVARLLARAGRIDAARKAIAQLSDVAENRDRLSHQHHAQYNLGAAYALMGQTRQAVALLMKAAREGLPCFPLFERDPDLDSLREDPEFAEFMRRLKADWARLGATL